MGEPEAGTAGHLAAARHQPKVSGESNPFLPFEECQNHTAKLHVDRGHHIPVTIRSVGTIIQLGLSLVQLSESI